MARILILEDERSQRFIMSDLLVRSGHEAKSTADPRAAIDLAEQFKPDVLVCDWLLKSDMTGRDAAIAIRAQYPNLPVVFITALPAGILTEQTIDLRPCKIVNKPCEFFDLLLAIHELLGDVVGEPAG
ncbi:MAG TPA: response regulator [Phycisphaerae bacterium]|jgi:CheY-like chemotaxis protein|nr:response regulator [Phycisphaerae bacterium]HOB73008.1 response regulator [Phycisphaerae bacterium]HOJ52943.1 response regulator [Phycisphaerae bacterium]HOL24680.1 response regulator [Phycisphaerae bacterium]HPP19216.1 response regulator [Phycisphaerae bacterium]